MPSRTSIQISTKNKPYVFYTNRAQQMKEMIDLYLSESDRVNKVFINKVVISESNWVNKKRFF